MNTKVVKKRKRFRLKTQVLAGLCCVLMVVAGTCAYLLFFGEKSLIDEAYANADTKTKLAGEEIVSDVYKNEDCVYALHYPKFQNELLDQKINAFVEKSKKMKDEQGAVYMDYDSEKVFDQYVAVSMKTRVYDQVENKKPVQEVTNIQDAFVYDLKANRVLEPKDCIRNRGLIPFKNKENLFVSDMDKSGITLGYTENGIIKEEKMNFEEKKNLFKLQNKNIPSILEYEPIVSKTHTVDDRPMIAFTFDDGPNGETTKRIADAFLPYDGRATFFELGSRMQWFPDVTRYLVEQGHQVASHSYDHPYFTDLSVESYMNQVTQTEDIFYSLTGHDITVFRPPGGFSNPEIEANVGVPFIMWDIDSLDWQSRNKDAVINEILPYIHDGAIVLCHDLYDSTAQAIEAILPILAEQGYQFVTVDELMARNGDSNEG